MTEAELDNAVAKLAKLMGIWAYHTRISIGSQRGMPDWLFVGRDILFRENKTEVGKLTDEQERVGERLTRAGADWAVWRPRDLRSGLIVAELEAIA